MRIISTRKSPRLSISVKVKKLAAASAALCMLQFVPACSLEHSLVVSAAAEESVSADLTPDDMYQLGELYIEEEEHKEQAI